MTQNENHKTWVEKLSDALLREPQTHVQLIELLRDAEERKLIDNQALGMIESILGYSALHARDVMIPRGQMVVIDYDMTASMALDTIINSTHSRFPVINQSRDEVMGILLAKDLLPLCVNQQSNQTTVEALIRPVRHVPESQRLDNLLKDFQKKRSHMAMVVDEYGGVSGLITIEDVLEQIVGDIEDETDKQETPLILKVSDEECIVKALMTLDDFNQHFNKDLSAEACDTIGGYVITQLGHLPSVGESLTIDNLAITVESANTRRLNSLRVIYTKHNEQK
jgi:magnesium and cobalt transporter